MVYVITLEPMADDPNYAFIDIRRTEGSGIYGGVCRLTEDLRLYMAIVDFCCDEERGDSL